MLFGAPKITHTITVPADVSDVDSTIYLASQVYGGETMNPSTLHEAYRKNPYSHLIVKDTKDNVLGYLDFFQLKSAVFEAFLQGTTTENYFEPSDVLAYGDPAAANRMYLAGMAAFTESWSERGRIVQMLLNGFARLLLAKYIPHAEYIEVYATGFSEEGSRLLQRTGFQCLNDGSARKDEQPLYRSAMDKAALQALANMTDRAERTCRLDIRN